MFINDSAKDKKLKNNILSLSVVASAAKKKDPTVINASSGMFKNEDGILYEFSSVKKIVSSLSVSEKYSYADSGGTENFTKAISYFIFGQYLEEVQKQCHTACIPTPGGSGALNLIFSNYVNPGETIFLPNNMWENYLNMCRDTGINPKTYRLFNEQGVFDMEGLIAQINELQKTQKRILILINDPCENPTGFCMKDEDYDRLIAISKNNPDTDFIYLMDIAYFDFYNVNPNIIRKRLSKLKDIPNNALAFYVFSGSKSFGLYGLRIGALMALSHDEQEIEIFKNAVSFSSRSKWSSAATMGINIVENLVLNQEYLHSYQEEIKSVCAALEKRSLAFLKSAKEVGLVTLPYERGFFVCVPVSNPQEAAKLLREDKVYLVATRNCLRIALCSINENEAARLPYIIKNRLFK